MTDVGPVIFPDPLDATFHSRTKDQQNDDPQRPSLSGTDGHDSSVAVTAAANRVTQMLDRLWSSDRNLGYSTEEQPKTAPIKITRSSRLREGSYDDSDAFPFKNPYPAAIAGRRHYQQSGGSGSGKPIAPTPSARQQQLENDGSGRKMSPKRVVSRSPVWTTDKSADNKTRNSVGNNSTSFDTEDNESSKGAAAYLASSLPTSTSLPRANRRGSHDSVQSLSQQVGTICSARSLPQCREIGDCRRDSSFSPPVNNIVANYVNSARNQQMYKTWSDQMELSISKRLFGAESPEDERGALVLSHWKNIMHMCYGALSYFCSHSKSSTYEEASVPVHDDVRKWRDLYVSKYFSFPEDQHCMLMNLPHQSTGVPSFESSVWTEASSQPFMYVVGAKMLWREVCKRCYSATDRTYAKLLEEHPTIELDDALNIFVDEVGILERVRHSWKTRDNPLLSATGDGAVRLPNDICVAYGAYLRSNTSSELTNKRVHPHYLMMSACVDCLSLNSSINLDTDESVDLPSWISQVVGSVNGATEQYSLHLLPFHCLSFVQVDSCWNKESMKDLNLVLDQAGTLLLETDSLFIGRVESTLKSHAAEDAENKAEGKVDDDGHFKQRVMHVIHLHIKDCETWFRFCCERNSFDATVRQEALESTSFRSCDRFLRQINLLTVGYRLLLACLERWCNYDDVQPQPENGKHRFSRSVTEQKHADTEMQATINIGIQRSHALHVCGQSAHLLGQSLAHLSRKDPSLNKKMQPHEREFYRAALKFYESIGSCSTAWDWDDDDDSVDGTGGEDRSRDSQRALILLHLASNEEVALDYKSAIGHYREAVAIWRNPPLWRYNLPTLTGNHWGDDDDVAAGSSAEYESDFSGSRASSSTTTLTFANSVQVSVALHRMGLCYIYLGDYKTAIECLRQAAELRKKSLLGPGDLQSVNGQDVSLARRQRELDLADTLQWLATAYREEGEPEQAYEVLRDCLIIKLLLFGKSHIDVANVQFNMGVILDDLSRHDESLECYRDALRIRRHFANSCAGQMIDFSDNSTCGSVIDGGEDDERTKNDIDIVNTLFCMGNVFLRIRAEGRKALDCFMEALKILETVAGLVSVTSTVDDAKCLGGIEASHICRDPEVRALKWATRQEKRAEYDRMLQYYTLALDLVADQNDELVEREVAVRTLGTQHMDRIATNTTLILDGMSKVFMAQMKWQLALETLRQKLSILHKHWQDVDQREDPFTDNSFNGNSFADKALIEEAYEYTLYNMGHVLFKLRSFEKAHRCYTDVLDAWRAHAKTKPDSMPNNIADVLHNKANSLKELKSYADAIKCYEESLTLRDEAGKIIPLGEIAVLKANTWYHLGMTYLVQNQYDKARLLFDQCISVYRANDSQILSEALVLHSIGKVHHVANESGAALDCYSASLRIYRLVAGEGANLDVAMSEELAIFIADALHNIGAIHDIQKQFDAAMINYSEALELYRSNCGQTQSAVATTLNNMGSVLMQQNQFSDALKLFEEALRIRKEQLGEEHKDVAQVWHNLGSAHDKLASKHGSSSLHRAVDCYKQALRIRVALYGETNLDVSKTWNNMGIVYTAMSGYENAIGCFNKTLQIRRELLGEDHVEVGNASHNLGNLYAKIGDFQRALEAYEIAYKIRIGKFGSKHFSVANTAYNKGNMYYQLGDKEHARQFYEEAMTIRDTLPSSSARDKVDLANSLQKVAQVEMEYEEYDKALPHYERALEIKRLQFGDVHFGLASILKETAKIYHEFKRDYKKAISSYTELMRIVKWNRGDDDLEVAHALNVLGYIYSDSNSGHCNLSMAVECHEEALRMMKKNSALMSNPKVAVKALCNLAICLANTLQGEVRHAILSDRAEEMKCTAIRHLENCIAIHGAIVNSDPESLKDDEMKLELAKALYYKGLLHMQFSGFSKNTNEDEDAIECFEESLARYRELLKADRISHASATSSVLQKLGMMWTKHRDYGQAMSCFREALKIRDNYQSLLENGDDENNKEMAEIYYGMGVVLCERRERNYEGSMECYKKALQIRALVLGPRHIDVAQTLNNIGSVYARMNKFSDAKDYWARALDIYRSNGLNDADEKVKCTVSNMELADKLVVFPSKSKKKENGGGRL